MLPLLSSEVWMAWFWEVVEVQRLILEMKFSMEIKSLRRCCLISSKVEDSSKDAIRKCTVVAEGGKNGDL